MGGMGGGSWRVVDQADWRPDVEPPQIHPGWQVVIREEPRRQQRPRWLPTRRHVDLAFGTLIHACLGALLTLILIRLLIELAG
jgi:hypothetical protein